MTIPEHNAEELLERIYTKLHSDAASDDSFLGEKDDAVFTKLYGDKALVAEGYGEVTFQGLASLLNGTSRRNSFMDLGSGYGRSVIYACLAGGFAECYGVELSKDRAALAKTALAEVEKVAPETSRNIQLFTGDMLAFPQYFAHDVILANNLLLPDAVQDGIAKQFTDISRPGTVLFTTKEVPFSPGVATMTKTAAGVSWQAGGNDFWFKYVKRE